MMGMTVIYAVQRESGRCELLRILQVLPLSYSEKSERISALKMYEEGAVLLQIWVVPREPSSHLAAGLFLYC